MYVFMDPPYAFEIVLRFVAQVRCRRHLRLTGLRFVAADTFAIGIDSEANCSDGLSRLGLLDPWTLRQGWLLSEAATPQVLHRRFPLRDLWHLLGENVG